MKKYSVLLLSLLLTSCNVDSSSLKIISPTGAPTLAFYNHSNNVNYETNSTPSNIVSMMSSSSDYDIVVIDTVSGIKAIEKGAPYKLAANITFGNFFIASTGNDENKVMDKDDTVIVFGQNKTPDLLFNYIYGNDYNVEYVTNKSNMPYSSVDKIAVYKGRRKKLMHCVHSFPTVSMAVFFANSFLRLIS